MDDAVDGSSAIVGDDEAAAREDNFRHLADGGLLVLPGAQVFKII